MDTNRRPWLSALTVLLALLVVIVLGNLVALLPSDAPRCPVGSAAVVLDPGHGGDDPGGANSDVGLVEREIVLEIAERVAAHLEGAGYGVALTRTGSGPTRANTPRGEIANACRAFAYVSIHLNAFNEPEPNYVKTFWGIGAKDLAFSEVMQAAMVAELRPGTELGDSGVEQLENGGLLAARMPAVLVEPVFLTNPAEAARLADPASERREQIARAITDGIDAWLRGYRLGPENRESDAPQPVLRPADPLLALPRGSPEQAMTAALAAGARRADEVRAYVEEVYRLAPVVGLDPAVVIAQSAHETGWWRSPAWTEHLNPAGIGITGPDVPSPTWDSGADAARGQLVHLYLYAVGTVPPGHPLAPYEGLDPRYAAAIAADRAGSAPTVADLTGRWATDPDYAEKVSRAGTELFNGR